MVAYEAMIQTWINTIFSSCILTHSPMSMHVIYFVIEFFDVVVILLNIETLIIKLTLMELCIHDGSLYSDQALLMYPSSIYTSFFVRSSVCLIHTSSCAFFFVSNIKHQF